MTEEVKVAPAVESKEPETVKTETEVKAEQAETKDVKVGDVLNTSDKKEPKMVPEAALLEYKKDAKELAKEVKELRKIIEEGKSSKEVSADIRELADEFGITESAVEKLVKKVGQINKEDLEKELEARLKPIQEKEKSVNVDKTFDEHFDKLMEAMPEFKTIANREVIKSLALDPKNANKTFAKILEESYGHLVTGKKTLEKTQARGGNSDAPIDFERAKKDMEYYKEIMANPELKKQYNDDLPNRLRL